MVNVLAGDIGVKRVQGGLKTLYLKIQLIYLLTKIFTRNYILKILRS